jgi:redox-sensitive bicupin YhaK (pirin superfamily)
MGPRYRDIKNNTVPQVELEKGVTAKVISGSLGGVKGPVKDLVIDISYYDFYLYKGAKTVLEIPKGRRSFVYVYAGQGSFGTDTLIVGEAGLFEDVRKLTITAVDSDLKFITASGKPIGEPVAWGGPIVMNTDEELELAFKEYENGTFIKEGKIPAKKKR